ncbi:MAG: hypothetical protein ACFFFC_15250 [Candidatus Thorarchaeota archaeon]
MRRASLLTCLLMVLISLGSFSPMRSIASKPTDVHTVADTDLNRVEWKTNHFPNPGFEMWQNPYSPDRISNWRTTERFTWYASAPWPVNESARSIGLQSRAEDIFHPGDAILTRSSWLYWDNPSNCTLKFDWYLDEMAVPTNQDSFRIRVQLGAPGTRYLYYYLGSQDNNVVNGSQSGYFALQGSMDTWNVFHRNLTQDFYEVFAIYPTQFQQFRFQLLTESSSYSRAFIDDIWLTNTTTVIGGSIGNGNLETNADWYYYTPYEAAIISQSSTRVEGDWSLNMTGMSNGNESRAEATYYPDIRTSSLNKDRLRFQWMIDDFEHASDDTYAYLFVQAENSSQESFYIYYVLCRGAGPLSFGFSGANIVDATGFNTTGQWNLFDRSIWDDVNAFNQTEDLAIREIELRIYLREAGARLSVLFDDIALVSSALNGMSYEDQGDIGDRIWSWNIDSVPDPKLTVTSDAHTGSKAANLTITNGDTYDGQQSFDYRPINNETDTWLDLYWRLDTFTDIGDDLLLLEVYFDSGVGFAYLLANASNVPTGNGFDKLFIVPEVNTVGVWHNLQRNLFDDYKAAVGTEPSTGISEVYLYAECDNAGGHVEVIFDDVYLYNDPAPDILEIYQIPVSVDATDDVMVVAEVIDPSLDAVTLYYRVDSGTWMELEMIYVSGLGHRAIIPAQTEGSEVEYYVNAADAFGQSTESSTASYDVLTIPTTSSTTTPEPEPPDMTVLFVAAVGGAIIIGILLAYFLVAKPKQQVE